MKPRSKITDTHKKHHQRTGLVISISLVLLLLAGVVLIRNNAAFAWRYDNLVAKIKYALNPPQKVIFVPQNQVALIVSATLKALTPSITPTPPATMVIDPIPKNTRTPTHIPTILPNRILLKGFRHEFQQWNNCGPANLAMILSYWGWEGDQRNTAAYLKPNPRDKNVRPHEMKEYIEENTEFSVLIRYGGDTNLLADLVAAGVPVLVERGFEGSSFDAWMGHYEVVSGYDLEQHKLYTQDSYVGPDIPVTTTQMESAWRGFNYVYLLVFQTDRTEDIKRILGPQADELYNLHYAADLATIEIVKNSGRDLFFAWYNRGTSLVNLGDYTGAASAFDEAYQIYPTLEEGERPWRIIWYQTEPYFAYYYTGRYYDVINLATSTLSAMSEPVLEESYVWRARARAALGDTSGALEDLNLALQYHPDYLPALEELIRLGGR